MSDATIVVSGLRKRFGATVALDGMSFTVRPGQVTGFVGPNGAGKSTTMRVILGLDAADAGRALIGGQPYRRPARVRCATSDRCWTRPRCSRAGPPATTCCGWPAPRACPPAGSTRCSSRSGWPRSARRRAGGYSLGMRQRLGHRRRAARRPAGADAGRAVQRHGPRGHHLDARLPAVAGRAGPGRAGLQPPDERAAGHRRPPGRRRPRPGHRRRERRASCSRRRPAAGSPCARRRRRPNSP